jgi:hypothetical protein
MGSPGEHSCWKRLAHYCSVLILEQGIILELPDLARRSSADRDNLLKGMGCIALPEN